MVPVFSTLFLFLAALIRTTTMKTFLLLFTLLYIVDCHGQVFVSKHEAEADIDSLNKILLEVHVDPFLFIPKAEYFAKVQELKSSVKDSIELKAFVLKLYRLTALLKDGHCAPHIVQPAFRSDLGRTIFFPYHLVLDKDRLLVPKTTSQATGIPRGATIISINNQKTRSILSEVNNTIGGDRAYSLEMEERLLPYLLYLCNVSAPFTVRYKNSSGQVFEKKINEGLRFADALAVTMPHLKTEYRFQVIDGKLGYFNFLSMAGDTRHFDKYLDSCITLLKTNGISHFAVDLRGNSGGNSYLGDLLISYFNTRNYTLMGGRKWKVSTRYKQHLLASGDSTNSYLQQENGNTWQLGSCAPVPSPVRNDNVFSGKVYLLTGPFTFSSANMVADGVKQFKMAEVIGEPTGENTNDFGEAFTFNLPVSKIRVQTSTSFDFGASCDKNSHSPVMPDKLIRRSLSDRIEERDRVLEFIVASAR
jgi:hypothetical protein